MNNAFIAKKVAKDTFKVATGELKATEFTNSNIESNIQNNDLCIIMAVNAVNSSYIALPIIKTSDKLNDGDIVIHNNKHDFKIEIKNNGEVNIYGSKVNIKNGSVEKTVLTDKAKIIDSTGVQCTIVTNGNSTLKVYE